MNIIKWIYGNLKDFAGFEKCYVESELKMNRNLLKWKWLCLLIFEGVAAKDFFTYRFYEKKRKERKTFVTMLYGKWYIHILNGKADKSCIEDKKIFAEKFENYLCRNVVASKNIQNFNEFKKLYLKEKNIIIKPSNGYNGKQISIIREGQCEEELIKLYEQLKKGDFVIETLLKQNNILHDLNPDSINTIRVNILNNAGNTQLVNACIRVGVGKVATDNLSSGGIGADINVKTGIVETDFASKNGKRYDKHPISGISIKGKKIPAWENVVALARVVAKRVPEITYTAWDIAVLDENRVALIEGNAYGNFHNQQMFTQRGVKKTYRDFIKLKGKER